MLCDRNRGNFPSFKYANCLKLPVTIHYEQAPIFAEGAGPADAFTRCGPRRVLPDAPLLDRSPSPLFHAGHYLHLPGVWGNDVVRLCQGLGQRAGGQEPGPAGGAGWARAGCSMGTIRAEEASGAKDDRSGLLELWTWWPRGTPWWSPTSTASPGG